MILLKVMEQVPVMEIKEISKEIQIGMETIFNLYKISEDTMKKEWIIFYLNLESYDQLCNIITPREPKDLSYNELIQILEDYYDPKPLEIVENVNFRKRIQKEGESMDDFMAALRGLTKYCNLGCNSCDNLNKSLRNQFVFGLWDKDVQKRLLEKKDLSLERALEIAKSMESSEKGKEDMTAKATKQDTLQLEATDVHKIQPNEQKENKKEVRCYRCGMKNHLANNCFHENSTCNQCGQTGHLQRVCKQKNTKKSETKAAEKKIQRVNEVDDILHVEEIVEPKVYLKFKFINNKSVSDFVKFEVDSGSGISIAGLKYKDDFFPDETIIPTKKEFLHYGGGKIAVVGFIRVSALIGKRVLRNVNLYFTEDRLRPPLLGREWIKRAKWVNWNKVLLDIRQIEAQESQVDKTKLVSELKKDFKRVFEKTTGKIEGMQAELKLQENASPVFLKHRNVPIPKKEAVENEIDRLVREGILVKVNQSRLMYGVASALRKVGNDVSRTENVSSSRSGGVEEDESIIGEGEGVPETPQIENASNSQEEKEQDSIRLEQDEQELNEHNPVGKARSVSTDSDGDSSEFEDAEDQLGSTDEEPSKAMSPPQSVEVFEPRRSQRIIKAPNRLNL
uniref:CCHC-type domain-containing protein n=1 Tax=Phlebotomus papatasi TaxID=29031 RepID=A0A1B0DRG4_PHLPP